MGLFGLFSKKISINSLGIAEKAAVETALEVAQMLDRKGELTKQLSSALAGVRKGKMTKEDIKVTVACLLASLAALTSGDDPDRSSQLQKKQVAQVSMALAIEKLKKLL